MNTDPNCLEGPGRTPEELAENFRELNKVAPTAAEKLMRMTGNLRPTPRTDACLTFDSIELCETLERELADALEQLAAMTDQRDAALMTIRLAQRTAGED